MEPERDELLRYKGRGAALEGECRMRSYRTNLGLVVLLDELATNPGPSVTNAGTAVIAAAARALGVVPEDTIWLEHYGDFSYEAGRGGVESFTRLRLEGVDVSFQHWPNQMVHSLIGDVAE